MRYAIISDIHSNLEALNAVIIDIKQNDVDRIICCGDIIGYGPEPNECIKAIEALGTTSLIDSIRGFLCRRKRPAIQIAAVLLGNHDAAVLGEYDLDKLNDDAKRAIEITRKIINTKSLKYLRGLPKIYNSDDFCSVHGSLRDPLNEYLTTREKLRRNAAMFRQKICFVGHTHKPLLYAISETGEESTDDIEDGKKITLLRGVKYIINVGSVGQPRDYDPRASVLYYDSSENTITMKRLEYDIKSVQRKMKKLNLPEYLIERLAVGR